MTQPFSLNALVLHRPMDGLECVRRESPNVPGLSSRLLTTVEARIGSQRLRTFGAILLLLLADVITRIPSTFAFR